MEHEAGGGVGHAIQDVADDGAGEALLVRAVDAELVGSAGVRDEMEAGDGCAPHCFAREDSVVADGGSALGVVDDLVGAVVIIGAEGEVDGALVGGG